MEKREDGSNVGGDDGEDPDSVLARAYLEEFLEAQGLTLPALRKLPKDRRRELLSRASRFASDRLADIEAKRRLLDELHHQPKNQ